MIAPAEESLFDRIGSLLPLDQRERFYRKMAHLRTLSPNDEMLLVCEAMGFLALIVRETPEQIATEREELQRIFGQSVELIQGANQKTFEFYQSVETRLAQLPADISRVVDTRQMALEISERLRQGVNELALPQLCDSLKILANNLTSVQKQMGTAVTGFDAPKTGIVARTSQVLEELNQEFQTTAGHLRREAEDLRHIVYHAAAWAGLACLILGGLIGAGITWWMKG